MRFLKPSRYPSLFASVAAALVVALILLGPGANAALASPVATQDLLEAAADATRERLHSMIDREGVARELERLGIDSAEAHRRIAALSNAELAVVQGRLDQLPAGADGVGAVVGAVVIIFLVLLVTDILGLTDVFPFVKKPAQRARR
jgi:uncharacterized protein DUF6627